MVEKTDGPVVIMLGTFDPFHDSHLEAGKIALRELHASRVIFFPNPGEKGPDGTVQTSKNEIPIEHRLEMARLVLESDPDSQGLEVATQEAIDVFRSSTNEQETIMQYYQELYPRSNIYRLSGSDSFLRWPQQVRQMREMGVSFAVIPRREAAGVADETEINRAAAGLMAEADAQPGWEIRVLSPTARALSSTEIRGYSQTGRRVAPDGISPEVWEYIKANALYGFRIGSVPPRDGTSQGIV